MRYARSPYNADAKSRSLCLPKAKILFYIHLDGHYGMGYGSSPSRPLPPAEDSCQSVMTNTTNRTSLSGPLSHGGVPHRERPRWSHLWAILGLFAGILVVVPSRAQEPQAPYVRHIFFEREPIFSKEDEARMRFVPLGWANGVHIDTREGTIRRKLLVSEGERAEPRLLEESERKLRETGYLVDVSIETQHVSPDSVDLYVHTREVWTSTFDIRFEKFENTTLLSFRVAEKNFLGTGRRISIARDEDLDRTTWSFGADDPHFLDGFWNVGFNYRDATDGEAFDWHFDRPFFQLDSPWAGYSNYVHAGFSPRYYLGGPYYVRPHGDFTIGQGELRRRMGTWGEGVVRAGFGLRLADQSFNAAEDLPVYDASGGTDLSADIEHYPETRDVRGPFVSIERWPTSYARRRFVDRMGRQEDIPLGHELRLAVGWVTRALGSSFSGLWFSGRDQWKLSFGRHVVRTSIFTEGLLGHGPGRDPNVKLGIQLRGNSYYSDKWTFAGSLLAATGSHLDGHRVYTLGIDSGLRSALPQEYPGDRLLRANLELRWVYPPGLIGLLTPGITGFADFGTAWFADERDLTWGDFRGALGVGFRFGMNRAALNAPLRVDFAWPVLYSTHRSAPVISIGVGQVF